MKVTIDEKTLLFRGNTEAKLKTVQGLPVVPPVVLEAGVTYEVTIRDGAKDIRPDDIREFSRARTGG